MDICIVMLTGLKIEFVYLLTDLLVFSRSYCYTVWSTIGITTSSVCPSVHLFTSTSYEIRMYDRLCTATAKLLLHTTYSILANCQTGLGYKFSNNCHARLNEYSLWTHQNYLLKRDHWAWQTKVQ